MYTDPDGREITEAEVAALLDTGLHIWGYMACGPLTVTTRWWGDPDHQWLTRAWMGDSVIGIAWAADKPAALAAHHAWCATAFRPPVMPLPQRRRSSSLAAAPSHPSDTRSAPEPLSA